MKENIKQFLIGMLLAFTVVTAIDNFYIKKKNSKLYSVLSEMKDVISIQESTINEISKPIYIDDMKVKGERSLFIIKERYLQENRQDSSEIEEFYNHIKKITE